MKPLRTPINADVSKYTLHLRQKFVTIGSCFSDCLGNRLLAHKVDVLVNPFGTVYNPISIHKQLQYALNDHPPEPEGYLENKGIHAHFDFHSRWSEFNRDTLNELLIRQIHSTHNQLTSADALVITYGTGLVYHRSDNGSLVANCHKQPLQRFSKSLLSVEAIIDSFRECHRQLTALNPNVKIIVTVSPVRHVKDTLELNSVSKATLRVVCHQLASEFSNVVYFPAFEIMMDDLRDYRFYKDDLIHPTELAEQYIWEEFIRRHFDLESTTIFQKWSAIRSALEHRPFHPASQEHQEFLRKTLVKLEELRNDLPVEDEIRTIQTQMAG